MPFSLDVLNTVASQATHPERLRDMLVLIHREVVMRASGVWSEWTGFEGASDEELELAFFRTVNELIVRWARLRDRLGNYEVISTIQFIVLLNIFQNIQHLLG